MASSRCLPNISASAGPYPSVLKQILSVTQTADAMNAVASWPGYAPTPLRDLSVLASAMNIRRLWYKDESRRFDLGSFKALGGAYAVYRILNTAAGARNITFACATAGNHGLSVAWAAKKWGAQCVVYVPAAVPEERIALLRSHGAQLRIVELPYDDTVDLLAADAARSGWHVVSDLAYPGYVEIPGDVMRGYTVLAREIVEQLPAGERITHAFLQCGVGGLAAAVVAHLWETFGEDRPIVTIVEPESAACFFESVRYRSISEWTSRMDTQLVCLACARLSILSWPILRAGADFAMTIPDEAAFEAMRSLANVSADAIACGECGAAGLGGLQTALAQMQTSNEMRLGPDSNVLIVGSEGPLNASLYRQITGLEEVGA